MSAEHDFREKIKSPGKGVNNHCALFSNCIVEASKDIVYLIWAQLFCFRWNLNFNFIGIKILKTEEICQSHM